MRFLIERGSRVQAWVAAACFVIVPQVLGYGVGWAAYHGYDTDQPGSSIGNALGQLFAGVGAAVLAYFVVLGILVLVLIIPGRQGISALIAVCGALSFFIVFAILDRIVHIAFWPTYALGAVATMWWESVALEPVFARPSPIVDK